MNDVAHVRSIPVLLMGSLLLLPVYYYYMRPAARGAAQKTHTKQKHAEMMMLL
jgi:hypothetical protein